jgi:hypothetical protein
MLKGGCMIGYPHTTAVSSLMEQVQLDFVASFYFTVSLFGWMLYRARPLEVTTHLTTETVKGQTLGGSGSRIDADGHAR